jgi:arsenate reductase
MKVLFICQGNVARSQMAEGYYNHFTKTNDATSAGVSDTAYKKYPRPVDEVVQVMTEEGIDVSEKKVKKLTQEMVDNAEKIFVLCDKEMCPAFLLDSSKVTFWPIEDPYETSVDNFRKIRDLIKSKIKSII